ncbi:MAG: 5-(carboxyamino)imidazole ribonucleotide synthase [Ignisphaera sp.]
MKFFLQDLSRVRVGILGGGQLGWMMVLEGRKYPLKFYVMDSPEAPACKVADRCFKPDEYKEMIDSVDVVTFEFEHVYEEALRYAYEKDKLLPTIESVELKRQRWKERVFYKEHGIPTPRFFIAHDVEEVYRIAKNEFDYKCVIKQSTGGYDGKGQFFIKSKNDLDSSIDVIKKISDVFVVEEFVEFDYEASIIAIRTFDGVFKTYPPTYNRNEKGILVYNYGPISNTYISMKMVEIAKRLADSLNYVGVMGIEFFVRGDEVLVNEFAPRVHNTGHYTLDAAFTSQFENHVRALLGLEIGETKLLSCGGMVNILGLANPPLEVLKYGKLYWYGKNEARKRRKMGHVNIVGETLEEVKNKIDKVMELLYPNGLDL